MTNAAYLALRIKLPAPHLPSSRRWKSPQGAKAEALPHPSRHTSTFATGSTSFVTRRLCTSRHSSTFILHPNLIIPPPLANMGYGKTDELAINTIRLLAVSLWQLPPRSLLRLRAPMLIDHIRRRSMPPSPPTPATPVRPWAWRPLPTSSSTSS